MKNLDHVIELIMLEWLGIAFLLLLCLVCIAVLCSKRGRRLKALAVIVCIAWGVWLVPKARIEYNLTLLSGEEDIAAEQGVDFLLIHLSDKHLTNLLSQSGQDHAYLASNNVRFYLALIAAERGLHVPTAPQLGQPRFFGTNKYNLAMNGIKFPLSYGQFLSDYQSRKGRPRN